MIRFYEDDVNTLTIEILRCPAISYMRKIGHPVSRYYRYTTTLLYKRLSENSGLNFSLLYYDDATGAARMQFIKKEK